MKKSLLFLLVFFVASVTYAEIVYTNYEDGWRIAVNENVPVDLDGDGNTDFFINGYENEIGFVPVFGAGCFSSPDEYVYNQIGSRKLSIHQEGQILQLNTSNLYNYIDDDRGSMYSTTNGFAEDWEDLNYQYIGFVIILSGTKTWDGWMRVAVDATTNEMIIKDMAYETEGDVTGAGPGIEVGKTGISAVATLDDLHAVNIFPNPAKNHIQVQYDYKGTADLSVLVLNGIGQIVYRHQNQAIINRNSISIQARDWTAGTYFIQFTSTEGTRTERFVISK